jgi:hypothetical protein
MDESCDGQVLLKMTGGLAVLKSVLGFVERMKAMHLSIEKEEREAKLGGY